MTKKELEFHVLQENDETLFSPVSVSEEINVNEWNYEFQTILLFFFNIYVLKMYSLLP